MIKRSQIRVFLPVFACECAKNFFGTKPKSIIKTDAMQRNAVSKSGIDLLIVLISVSDS